MGRLPSIKNLKTEDYLEQKSWIGKLLAPLNQFMQVVYSTLNGGIEFGTNIRSQVTEVTYEVGVTSFPIRFQSSIGKPQGLLVVNVVDISDTPTTLSAAVFPDWSYVQGMVHINALVGLSTAGKKYRLTVISL